MEITELSQFKNMGPHLPTTVYDIPEKEENRYPTDRPFFIAFIVSLLLLLPFVFYTLAYSDIRRLDGYDDCGNICGSTNTEYERWNCTGQDFTKEKYLKKNLEGRKCVADCGEDYNVLYGRCVRKISIFEDEDVDRIWTGSGTYLSRGMVLFRLFVCSLIAIGVSFAVLYLFRYAVGFVVWSIIICTLVLSVILVIVMWTEYADEDSMMDSGYSLFFCILATIFVVVYIAFTYLGRDKVRLVIILLTEATNAIFHIPSLVVVPIYALFIDMVLSIIWLVLTIYMLTGGVLTKNDYLNTLDYVPTDGMMMTLFSNTVMTIWALLFINGMQYMVIGGAVSEWYFAHDKTYLQQPVRRSFRIAYKYHIGTVAFGSLIMTLAQLFRAIIKSLTKSRFTRVIVDCCLRNVEALLQYISKRAYIVTAMHGQPFLKSGKRAVTLLSCNLADVVTHTVILRLTMGVVMLLIAITTVLLSMLLFIPDMDEPHVGVVFFIIFVIAVYAANVFVSLFQTTIDTIFICYCEDKFINDGIERPYAMTKELLEFVEGSKKGASTTEKVAQFVQETVQPQIV